MSNNSGKHVAVIGAGPAGLVTAKTPMQAGLRVTVFEIGTQIGGTWVYRNDNNRAYIYRNLHINTAKRYTRFSDLDFAPGVSAHPSHWDMDRYLRDYAVHFGVADRIKFRSEATAVRPGMPGGGWTVETRDRTIHRFDAVAVCASPFNRPRHAPEIRGRKAIAGMRKSRPFA